MLTRVFFGVQLSYRRWNTGLKTEKARGLAIAPDGNIWLADSVSAKVFNRQGLLLFLAKGRNGTLKGANSVAIDTNGEVFLTSGKHDEKRVVVCRLDGSFLREFGNGQPDDRVEEAWNAGGIKDRLSLAFDPIGVAVDGKGLVFVLAYANEAVYTFTRAGAMVSSTSLGFQPDFLCLSPQNELWIIDRALKVLLLFSPFWCCFENQLLCV